MSGPEEPNEFMPPTVSTTTLTPPTTTVPPSTTSDASGRPEETTTTTVAADTTVVADTATVDRRSYLIHRNPADAFEVFINMLLDNKLFYVEGLVSGNLAQYSGQPMLDPFGIATEGGITGQATTGSQVGWAGIGAPGTGATADMIRIDSPEGTKILKDAWAEDTSTTLDDSEQQNADFETWRAISFAGHTYMYIVNNPNAESTRLAILPTYDGGIMGNLSTIEDALRAVPLDKPTLDAFTSNMAKTDPRKYRALQATLSMMGYYGDKAGEMRWGSNSYIDQNAFTWMMQDIITDELRVARHNRENPGLQLPNPTIRSFVDQKYSDHLTESVRQANAGADGLTAFNGDASQHIQNSLVESLNYLGQNVTKPMQDRIGSMINEMFVEGDLDAAAILNTDLVGMQTNDQSLRSADAWLAAFHGNEEGWEENIQFGVNGTPTELLRIAQGAGVDLTGVHVGKQGTVRELGPDGEMRNAPITGEFAPISGMTGEQRHNVARWYFLTLLQQNNGNLSTTANQYANTIGNRVFEKNQFNGTWLDNTVRLANQDPTSFAYRQGVETYEEQNQERIDAMNNVQARVMASEEFSGISNKVGMKGLGAVLNALGSRSGSRQRKPRV